MQQSADPSGQPQVPPVDDNAFIADTEAQDSGGDDEEEEGGKSDKKAGRRKIKIEFIQDKSRRHITFSKRKAGESIPPLHAFLGITAPLLPFLCILLSLPPALSSTAAVVVIHDDNHIKFFNTKKNQNKWFFSSIKIKQLSLIYLSFTVWTYALTTTIPPPPPPSRRVTNTGIMKKAYELGCGLKNKFDFNKSRI